MQLVLNFGLLVIGFIALIKGADWFVDGSAGVARNLRVSGLIIGLTIVAMGTSAPELAVSTTAAIKGSNEIALSNVVGSNIFNLMVVLGVCACIHKVPVGKEIIKRDLPLSIIMMAFTLAATCFGAIFSGDFLRKELSISSDGFLHKPFGDMVRKAGMVERWISAVLIVVFAAYIIYLIYDAKKNPSEDEDAGKLSPLKCALLIIVGLVLIIAGGQAVVKSSQFIARSFGMTETLIGLTVVALGTSLPELVTSIVAARKGETELAVGNVVGSNIFNNLLILGVSSFIHPIAVNRASLFDMIILILMSIFILVLVGKNKELRRWGGISMLLIYALYMVFAIIR